jgi:hypothetical protein
MRSMARGIVASFDPGVGSLPPLRLRLTAQQDGTTTSWAESTLRMVRSADKPAVASKASARRPLRTRKRLSRWMVNGAMAPKDPA